MSTMVEISLEPKIIPFKGRNGQSYNWEIYSSGSVREGFLGIPELKDKVDTVQVLYSATYPYRNPVLAEAQVLKVLGLPKEYLMLARDEAGEYVGYGAFPRSGDGDDTFMYSSRAFLAEHESAGLGTNALDQAIDLHNEELAKIHRHLLVFGALYTQNPASVASVIRSERTDNVRPFRNYGGRYEMNSRPQGIMKEVAKRFLANSITVDNLTGVCTGELWGLGANQSYMPGRSALADEIYKEMISRNELNMNIPQGDVVILVYDIKKPESAERAPLELAA